MGDASNGWLFVPARSTQACLFVRLRTVKRAQAHGSPRDTRCADQRLRKASGWERSRSSRAVLRAIAWVVEGCVALSGVTPAGAERGHPPVSQCVGVVRGEGAAPIRNIGKPVAAVTYQTRARRHRCAQDRVGVGEIQAQTEVWKRCAVSWPPRKPAHGGRSRRWPRRRHPPAVAQSR